MHKIYVRLPLDRDYAGLLEVQTPGGTRIAGPYEACGRADDRLARDHRNPYRDPLLPFGDIPCGEYWVAGIVASGAGTEYEGDEYGAAGVVVLEPRNGEAALADANGRFRFLIHGGKPAAGGGLRPTDGSLRLSNRDQRDLIAVLRRLEGSTGTCLVIQVEHLRTRRVVAAPRANEPRYAQIVSALSLSAISRRSRMLATFWLRAMMGATGALVAVRSALGFSLGNTPSDASGNLRAALQAKGSSSGLSGKPHFIRGRLYAQAGGDYSQPAPEEQAPAPEQQTPAAPEEQTPAPQQAPEEETPTPQPEEETPTPQPEEETPAPAPQEETPAPEPQEETPAPAPQEETPAPEPQEETPAPAPQEETPAPEPQEETPAPAPQEETPAPAPQEEAPAPAPQEAAPAEEQSGANTNPMDQLKSTEQSSQQATQAPTEEEAKEKSGEGFDTAGKPATTSEQAPNEAPPPVPQGTPVVPLTPFPAGAPKLTPAPAEQQTAPQQQAPAPQEQQAPEEQAPEEQAPEEETPTPEEETPAPQEEAPTSSAPEYQAPTPAQSPAPAPARTAPRAVNPQQAPAVRSTGSQSVQPPLAVPFGQQQGARPQPQPAPAAPPGWQGLDDIDAVNALAAGRWGFTPEQRRLLNAALQAGHLRRTAAPTQDQAVIAAWRNIEARGQDPELAREATNGPGLGFAGAGTQSFNDCAIFALANASGRPYGVVAASADELLRDATWRDAADRAHPQTAIERGGLSMPEVIMLSQNFGRGTIVESGGFAASLRQGHPIVVGVAMQDGDWSGGHMVAITGTFQHNGEPWYVMMDSNQGPMERRFVSARELDTIRETNGIAFSPNPGTTPALLR